MSTILHKQQKVSAMSNLLMIITSIHHVQGAIHYATPERFQVLCFSIPILCITLLFDWGFRRNQDSIMGISGVLYAIVILFPSLLLIGVVEGIYNHVFKNILFFAGAPDEVMLFFFRSELYEAPNNFIFEFTGIAQGIIVIPLIVYFIRFVRQALAFRRSI